MIESILKQAKQGICLNEKQLNELLCLKIASKEYYELLAAANDWSRKQFENKGKIFAQIGLDNGRCSVDCKFCSMAKSVSETKSYCKKSIAQVTKLAADFAKQNIQDLFLMTTADFSQKEFLEYGKAVKAVLPPQMRLVANIGDFDFAYAQQLKQAGFTGVYHICRLGEGTDTKAKPETRIKTMNAVKDAGLELYYCVEPIGPEHTNQELIREMMRMKEYPVGVMAVMKRVAVEGTELYQRGEISASRLAQICAVTVLACQPSRAMCVHEPDELCLMAGANQLYAEQGSNPRDTEEETSKNRGFCVAQAEKMLWNTGWK